MRSEQVSRASGIALVGLALAALLLVLVFGLAQPPQPRQADEGAPAHIFQLIIVSLVPVGLVYLATADWKQPWRALRPLALAAVLTVLAFAALFYLENLR